MTTTTEIITALKQCTFTDCTFAELEDFRAALDAKAAELKATFMARAEAMGIRCQDGNGRKPRKPRSTEAEEHPEAN
jgi:hypothetical protein